MRFNLASIAAFAATATALSIKSPTKNENVDLTKSTTIEWESVESDPSSFSIYLVNMHGYPNVHKLVAENVKTSDGSYTMDNISGIDKGSGFQVNFVSNDDQNSGILAQSSQFKVKSSTSSSTTKSKTNKPCKHSKTHTHKKHPSTTCTRAPTATSTTSSTDTTSTSNPTETTAAPVYSGGAGSLNAQAAGSAAAGSAAAGSLLMGVFFWTM